MNDIGRKGEKQVLSDHTSNESLANDFARYFKENIEKIVDNFPVNEDLSELDTAQSQSVDMNFTEFKTVSITDIKRYISQAPNKYCPEVDPLPSELIKANIDILGPILKTIINKSITSATVP